MKNIFKTLMCLIFVFSVAHAEDEIERKKWDRDLIYVEVRHPSYKENGFSHPEKTEWVACDPNKLDAQVGDSSNDGSYIMTMRASSKVLSYPDKIKVNPWIPIYQWPSIRDDKYKDKHLMIWWHPIPPYYHIRTPRDPGLMR